MDDGLAARVRQGDRQAFGALYSRWAQPALRAAAAIVGHDGLAADAVQETFLRVYRNIGAWDPNRPFAPWFYRILINESRRTLRWKKRLLPVEVPPESPAPRDDGDMALYEAIRNLKPSLREPLVLRYLIGYGDKEAADILGISLSAQKSRVKRAKRLLAQALNEGEPS